MIRNVKRLSRKTVLSELSRSLVVRIDPKKVVDHVSGNAHCPVAGCCKAQMQKFGFPPGITRKFGKYLTMYEPYVIWSRLFTNQGPIRAWSKYQKIENLIANAANIHRSDWFEKLNRDLMKYGRARYKGIFMNRAEEIDAFFQDYFMGMIDSMRTGGYDEEKAPDTGQCQIDEHGNLIKSGVATHRFCVAKILGIQEVPWKVAGVHAAWGASVSDGRGRLSGDRLVEEVQRVAQRYR